MFPSGRTPRTIRGGLLAGLRMQVDFAHETQRWLGLQEREIHGLLRRFSEGIRTAVDVGASDGMYTLYFLARTPAQKVLAFEPCSERLSLLKANLALNHLEDNQRLEMVPKFVRASLGADSVTLDSFAPSIVPPCLVKVDVEGGEAELLRGAPSLLGWRGMRWIIEVHSKDLEEECIEILRAAHYRTQIVPNAWWRAVVPELRPLELNHWLVAVQENLHVAAG